LSTLEAGWNLRKIGLHEAWAVVPDAPAVTVAVLDSEGHGAVVCDLIAAVAPGVRTLRIKVRDEDAAGSVDDAVAGIVEAIAKGAEIINLSWGGPTFHPPLKACLDQVAASHPAVLVMASAGNGGRNIRRHPHYPASFGCSNVLVVTATRGDDELGGASNWDPLSVHLAAPGYIISACGGTYSGTSFATAQATGAAALLKARHPTWGFVALKRRLLDSADSLPALRGSVAKGRRLNVARAVYGLTEQPLHRGRAAAGKSGG
jgi:subtilisin family serine protease